jgi:phosphodiesterase/alkaline phosphatase D-like protein
MASSRDHQRVLVGPVIGQVTTTSARVLLEMLYASEVTIKLATDTMASPRASPQEHTLSLAAKKPVVFTFDNLIPGTSYSVTVTWPKQDKPFIYGRVRTFSDSTKAQANVGCVSCNSLVINQRCKQDKWTQLHEAVRAGELDVLIHMGDQVCFFVSLGQQSRINSCWSTGVHRSRLWSSDEWFNDSQGAHCTARCNRALLLCRSSCTPRRQGTG